MAATLRRNVGRADDEPNGPFLSTEQYDSSYPQNPEGAPQQPAEGQGWGQPQYAAPQAYGTPAPQGYGAPAPQGYPAPQPGYGYPPAPAQTPSNGVGIAGFVTGLLGLVLCWVPWLGILLAIVGTALSGVGIAQGKKKGAHTGLAIAGLVCGIIALVPAIIIMVALFSVASELNGY